MSLAQRFTPDYAVIIINLIDASIYYLQLMSMRIVLLIYFHIEKLITYSG
jgi:hypothetical protein